MTDTSYDVAAVREAARGFSPRNPELADDPYPFYESLRHACPVAHSEQHDGFYLLSKYEDVRHALMHPEIFSSRENQTLDRSGMGQSRPLIPLMIDPPDLLKYRRVLTPLFTRQKVSAYEDSVRTVVRGLLDRFAGRGDCEFNEEFAKLLPSYAFVEFVGWPPEDADFFHEVAFTAIHGARHRHGDPTATAENDEDATVKRDAAVSVTEYFHKLVAERRADPTGDVISQLLDAPFDEHRSITDDEIVDIMFLLVIAGFDTTRKALGLSVAHLAEHPEQRDKLTADLSLVPTAVEELLRFESMVSTLRTVEQDITIGGHDLHPGDRVWLITGSADRDEDAFEDAGDVRLDRKRNNHLAFGAGAHQCMGMHFARLELQIAMEELHRRLPDYRVAPGRSVERTLNPSRGVDLLPLVFTPNP
jgi:cytochrome P450